MGEAGLQKSALRGKPFTLPHSVTEQESETGLKFQSEFLHGLLHCRPIDDRSQPPPRCDSACERSAEGAEGQRMVLNIENQHNLGFFVRNPWSGLERHSLWKSVLDRPADQIVHLLERFFVADVEIDFVEIERHFSFLLSFRPTRRTGQT